MSEKKFKEYDVVINTQNGKEYYITQIEKVYDVDLGHSVFTGYAECHPNNLDDNLKEIALLRLEYPDMSLVELGKKLKEPLGKSGVNYRLKRIIKIAEDL